MKVFTSKRRIESNPMSHVSQHLLIRQEAMVRNESAAESHCKRQRRLEELTMRKEDLEKKAREAEAKSSSWATIWAHVSNPANQKVAGMKWSDFFQSVAPHEVVIPSEFDCDEKGLEHSDMLMALAVLVKKTKDQHSLASKQSTNLAQREGKCKKAQEKEAEQAKRKVEVLLGDTAVQEDKKESVKQPDFQIKIRKLTWPVQKVEILFSPTPRRAMLVTNDSLFLPFAFFAIFESWGALVSCHLCTHGKWPGTLTFIGHEKGRGYVSCGVGSSP